MQFHSVLGGSNVISRPVFARQQLQGVQLDPLSDADLCFIYSTIFHSRITESVKISMALLNQLLVSDVSE